MGAEDEDEEEDAGQAPPAGRPPPRDPAAGRGIVGARATEMQRRAGRRRDGDENGPAAVTTGYWRPPERLLGNRGRENVDRFAHARKHAAGTPLSTAVAIVV